MKFIRNIVIFLYAMVAIFVTICLLSYNDYKVTVFGSTSWLIMDSTKFEPEYKKGSIVLVDADKPIEVGDVMFYYNHQAAIVQGEVFEKETISDTQTTYKLEDGRLILSDYVIGNVAEAKQIEKMGAILQVLLSRWGFLLLVVVPAIMAFLYEIFEVFTEIRGNKGNQGSQASAGTEENKESGKRSNGRRSSGRRH